MPKNGRIVLVGDVGLHLNRQDIYEKELDFLVSTSYGPGRYDRTYEERGLDYPVAYIRWTENRNMGEYLRLVEEKRLNIAPLIGGTYSIEQVGEAYAALADKHRQAPIVLLPYPDRPHVSEEHVVATSWCWRTCEGGIGGGRKFFSSGSLTQSQDAKQSVRLGSDRRPDEA